MFVEILSRPAGVGNSWDVDLLLFADGSNSAHDPGPGMPDRPQRIDVCLKKLEQAGESFQLRAAEPASFRDLQRAHDRAYLEHLEAFCARGGGWIDADTPALPGSYGVAVRAAGSCCAAVDDVLARSARAFCLVRPPGHHATSDQAMGFCLVNNLAVGAAHALAAGLERVLILDIDVHHGNGTQEIFWENPRVCYVSIHQWPWYPWTSGDLVQTGEGKGEGFNVNVPLPEGCGNEVYEQAMASIVAPVARQFRPEIILVSAGYDAHLADHLSLQRVTSAGFGRLTSMILDLAGEVCEGRVVFALEGGYNLEALAQSVEGTVRVLSDKVRDGSSPSTRDKTGEHHPVLQPIVDFHRRHWELGG